MNDTLEFARRQVTDFVAIRRDIHQHPELSFEERRTSELVASLLQGWGYKVHCGVGGFGVVGQMTRGTGGRSIGLRADMDALPIHEATGAPYASRSPGIMHACGHDGHTTMLLAAARALAERQRFNGTVNLIFQPAEEFGGSGGGAARMIADGLFEKFPCDAVFGMHTMPGIPQGKLVFRDGPFMAASDGVFITLHGNGGHGAVPHKATDPIVPAASLVMALQTLIARNVSAHETAVLSVGTLQAGDAANVIPQIAKIGLSVRTFNPRTRSLLEQRIKELINAQAQSFGVSAEVEYRQGCPAVVNTAAEASFARQVGVDLIGADEVEQQYEPLTISEDFGFMLEQRPGAFLFIGNGAGAALHNPGFDFNDDNIVVGSAYWTALAERYLSEAGQSSCQ
ncbi:M20 aminoacylase family protein [Sinorhizobium sp. GL28]|uniref:M20 aminoacylase family protein n=1 Tax=Sinorhizobium sp. GL28 TaxID=1358418 RepID=UPI00071C7389|nr:M20 aminoacylase family protein [Sinorhizobium sp. GL28]KSV84178.1 hypothetical protein N184_12860 [Sinorhizobium sp. GL28]